MPPSWCCTVLRFMSTLTKPGRDRRAGQRRKRTPRRRCRGRAARRPAARRGSAARDCRAAVDIRRRLGEGAQRIATRFRPLGPPLRRLPTLRRSAGSGCGVTRASTSAAVPELFDRALAQHQHLSTAASNAGAMGDDHDALRPRLQRAERREQRHLALGIQVRIGLVEHHEARVAVEGARERDALALSRRRARRPPRRWACRSLAAGAGSSRARWRAARRRPQRRSRLRPGARCSR